MKDVLFIFNEKLYKQINGVAMGSPLRPTLANIFLGYHERRWLDNCPLTFKPVFYSEGILTIRFCYLGMNLASKIS